ncbi:hypothetical protein XH98_37465 [Bradyrhizobium sp. CCBAU 51745]|uniref:hypothetical protein n=1 Tax=Bradyrhizobium sp. CCBAU 51745 TaxID=1325099 RepID=UPI002305B173|nr:hypothetical protein [Bradyrhizobium sp. CCBAU 51745]MDA9444656.1 hypothetical protein [Bradyrhizobium sp. CCBAU 51745]
MAREVTEVDRSSVMVGDVTAANFPQVFKNARRSSSSLSTRITISPLSFKISLIVLYIKLTFNRHFLVVPKVTERAPRQATGNSLALLFTYSACVCAIHGFGFAFDIKYG